MNKLGVQVENFAQGIRNHGKFRAYKMSKTSGFVTDSALQLST